MSPGVYEEKLPVVLLGAGASAEAHLPLSREITARAISDLSDNQIDPRIGAALNLVVAAIMHHDSRDGVAPTELPDIERVASSVELLADRNLLEVSPFVSVWDPALTSLEKRTSGIPWGTESALMKALGYTTSLYSHSRTESASRPNGRELVQVLEKMIVAKTNGGRYPTFAQLLVQLTRSLRPLLTPSSSSDFDYLTPLAEISLAHTSQPFIIGTLNYDLGVEIMSERAGCPVETGALKWAEGDALPCPSKGIRLLKLHGSLDWLRDEKPFEEVPSMGLRILVDGNEDGDEDKPPFIVFGQREKLRAAGPFLELLEAYRHSLRESDDMIVVGYGFRDAHLNELVSRWFARKDIERRLFIVDPYFPTEFDAPRGAEDYRERLTEVDLFGNGSRRAKDGVILMRESASSFLNRIDPAKPRQSLDEIARIAREKGSGFKEQF